MRHAIRSHLRDFVAIIGLVIVAAIVGGYILDHQRLHLPGWVPVLGSDSFQLKGEFVTAQAITPGQGQAVDIAGVQVGAITGVKLEHGRAVVTMRIDPRYAEIYSDATLLMRPKTPLKDMVIALDPGTRAGGERVDEDYMIPVSNTKPDVNLDQILANLDRDTRTYLQLLLNSAAVGLTGNGDQLAQVFRRFDPLADDAKKATELLIDRRRYIRRAMTNFGKFTHALSRNDAALMEFVDSSQAVFRRFAAQADGIEQMLAQFPSTLRQTRSALEATGDFADAAGGALHDLRPFARALGPALRATRPFFEQTTPIIRDQIRPFTRAATPVIRTLRPAARELAAATPDLVRGFGVFNRFLNALAYNPPGDREGYLFYLTWLGHLANSTLAVQDAMGSMLRSALFVNCGNRAGLAAVKGSSIPAAAALTLAAQLSNLPDNSPYCEG